MENNAIPRIASGFAGGIGMTGTVCGAVSGAVMAIGLKQERAGTMEEILGNAAVVREFRRRFEAEMGTIICRELTGVDLSEADLTPKGIEQFTAADTSQTICIPAAGAAYRLAVDLLKETSWAEGA